MLSGHTDVVPVDGQPWDSDPWQAVEVGDRLVGRGVCDMKSFIADRARARAGDGAPQARATAAFRAVVRRGSGLHRRAPADRRPRQCGLLSRAAASSASPPAWSSSSRTRASARTRCRVRGFEAHSALTPKGVNAVEIACEIVALPARHGEALSRERPLRSRLRRAVHDGSRRHDQGRHGAQHRAARLRVPVRVPPPAVRRSRLCCCAR